MLVISCSAGLLTPGPAVYLTLLLPSSIRSMYATSFTFSVLGWFPSRVLLMFSSLYVSLYCDRAASQCSRSSAIDLHTPLPPRSVSIRYWPSCECAAGADQIVATDDHDQVDRVELDVVLHLVGVHVKADFVVCSTPSSSLSTLICARWCPRGRGQVLDVGVWTRFCGDDCCWITAPVSYSFGHRHSLVSKLLCRLFIKNVEAHMDVSDDEHCGGFRCAFRVVLDVHWSRSSSECVCRPCGW